jgi:hypothetical protein
MMPTHHGEGVQEAPVTYSPVPNWRGPVTVVASVDDEMQPELEEQMTTPQTDEEEEEENAEGEHAADLQLGAKSACASPVASDTEIEDVAEVGPDNELTMAGTPAPHHPPGEGWTRYWCNESAQLWWYHEQGFSCSRNGPVLKESENDKPAEPASHRDPEVGPSWSAGGVSARAFAVFQDKMLHEISRLKKQNAIANEELSRLRTIVDAHNTKLEIHRVALKGSACELDQRVSDIDQRVINIESGTFWPPGAAHFPVREC